MLKITNAPVGRVYSDSLNPQLKVLSAGQKLTTIAAQMMSFEPGNKINYGKDEEGNMYLYKSDEGAVLGKKFTFTSTLMRIDLLKAAGLEAKVNGEIPVFKVHEAVDVEGTKYFRLEYTGSVKESDEDEVEETPVAKATPTAKGKKAEVVDFN